MPVRINYLDASAIVKLVIEEERSKIVRDYFSYFGDSYLTTSLCFSESLGVLNLKYKKGDVAQEVYLRATEELLALGRNCSIEIHDVKISERRVFDEVEQMISAHQKGRGKRLDLSDAFQIVTLKKVFPKVEKSAKLLITADRYLAEAAITEGLSVWNVMIDDPPKR